MDSKIGKKMISGMGWKFGERIIAQGVSFVVSIILARLLSPDEYGTVSLVMVFIAIANVLVSEGLGASLIRKKDAGDVEFSTMLFFSLFLGCILYILLYFAAPFISSFYKNEELTMIIRVLSIQVPLAALKSIQNAYVSKRLMFRKFFFSTLGGTVFSGIVGIIMAYNGWGVWALVVQYLVNSFVDMLVLLVTVNWKPKLIFRLSVVRECMSYSWKLLAASLINTIYNESRALIIGKEYTETDLAYTTKGSQFPSLLITNVNVAISSVLFPVMSMIQDDFPKLKEMTRKSLQTTTYLLFPLLIGMMTIAETMVKVLLTEEWMGCVPYLVIACMYWMFQPCLTANNEALKAVGRSDLCLKLEVLKKIIGFLLVLLTMKWGVFALAMSNVFFAFISTLINIFPVRQVLSYGYKEQFKDMMPSLILSFVMGIVVYFVGKLDVNDVLLLFIQIVAGILLYIGLSFFLKVESFVNLKKIISNIKKKEAEI